jgi:hypothetical protein
MDRGNTEPLRSQRTTPSGLEKEQRSKEGWMERQRRNTGLRSLELRREDISRWFLSLYLLR